VVKTATALAIYSDLVDGVAKIEISTDGSRHWQPVTRTDTTVRSVPERGWLACGDVVSTGMLQIFQGENGGRAALSTRDGSRCISSRTTHGV
jgi:hypothetical protein